VTQAYSEYPGSSREARFATTRWTVVVAAGGEDSPDAREALEFLCRKYWYPLYFYLRRQGYSRSQAEDSVQGFFAHLLEKHGLQSVQRQKHKFRSFLLASLKNFVVDEWRRTQAQRRGGGKAVLSLAFDEAETRYSLEPSHSLSAKKLFDRSWAMTVIGRALEALEREYAEAGKNALFAQLKTHITTEPERGFYQQCAAHLNMSVEAVRVAAHRLRRRLRELIRQEISETVTTAEQLEEEIRELFTALEP